MTLLNTSMNFWWHAGMKSYPGCELLCTSWAQYESLTCWHEIPSSMWVAVLRTLMTLWLENIMHMLYPRLVCSQAKTWDLAKQPGQAKWMKWWRNKMNACKTNPSQSGVIYILKVKMKNNQISIRTFVDQFYQTGIICKSINFPQTLSDQFILHYGGLLCYLLLQTNFDIAKTKGKAVSCANSFKAPSPSSHWKQDWHSFCCLQRGLMWKNSLCPKC